MSRQGFSTLLKTFRYAKIILLPSITAAVQFLKIAAVHPTALSLTIDFTTPSNVRFGQKVQRFSTPKTVSEQRSHPSIEPRIRQTGANVLAQAIDKMTNIAEREFLANSQYRPADVLAPASERLIVLLQDPPLCNDFTEEELLQALHQKNFRQHHRNQSCLNALMHGPLT